MSNFAGLGLYYNDSNYLNVSQILQLAEITVFLAEHVSCRPDGMVEYWNVGMLVWIRKLLILLPLCQEEFYQFTLWNFPEGTTFNRVNHYPIFLEPIIPSFHYSNIPILSEAN